MKNMGKGDPTKRGKINRELASSVNSRPQTQDIEERYQALFERSRDAVYIHDIDGNFTDVNVAWLKMTGYEKADILKLKLFAFLPQDQISVVMEATGELINNGVSKFHEFKLKRKDGSFVDVEATSFLIHRQGKPVAVMGIARDITERKKSEEELRKINERLQKAMTGAVETISMMSELRDPYTAGHQYQVARLSAAIAEELGLPEKKVSAIRMAGTLHDIGKVSIPSEILSKPGQLSKIEMDMIRSHPKVGMEILKSIDFPFPICKYVVEHHERMDGSGYPSGLKGEEISIEARILAVADVVSAMGSHRHYRPALGIERALEEITKNKSTLYDPAVVDACLTLFTQKGFNLE
jgi:PAS domain S-box-containing protein/putative nucleotidyltransferase with HDIG domain